MVNFPVFFTSEVASETRSSITLETAFFSKPVLDANASVIPLFGIAFTALPFMTFMAFMAFMAAFFFITFMAFMGAAAFMARFMAAFF